MRKTIYVLIILFIGLTFQVMADEPIGVFVNNPTNCIQFINPLTQEVSPSLLKGELGFYDYSTLTEVLLTSDGKTAVVNNAELGMLYLIDISGGFLETPTILGEVYLGASSFDMVLTADDKYALLSGGFFQQRNKTRANANFFSGLTVVNLATLEVQHKKLGNNFESIALDITPDGKTVLFLDILGGMLHSFAFDSTTGDVTFKDTSYLPVQYPNNFTVSPDGKTILINFLLGYKLGVVTLYGDSQLHINGIVQMPAKGGQSIVFSKDGTKAYCLTSSTWLLFDQPTVAVGKRNAAATHGSQVLVFDITAPGIVTVSDSIPLSLPRNTVEISFDSIALDPSGNYLYVSNPFFYGGVVEITVVDLTTHTEVNQLHANGLPVGIAFGTIKTE